MLYFSLPMVRSVHDSDSGQECNGPLPVSRTVTDCNEAACLATVSGSWIALVLPGWSEVMPRADERMQEIKRRDRNFVTRG